MKTLRIFAFIIFILCYASLNAQESNPQKNWWGLSMDIGAFGPTDEMKKHMIHNNYNARQENWFGGRDLEYPRRESPFVISLTLAYGADINPKSKYELLMHIAHLGEISGHLDYPYRYVTTSFQSIGFTPTLIFFPSRITEFQFGPVIYLNNTRYDRSSTGNWSGGMLAGLNFILADKGNLITKSSIRYYAAVENKVGPFPPNDSASALPETEIGFGHLSIGLSLTFARDKR